MCLTYGHRARPFGIRARLSRDGGRTWAQEIILRDDGGGTDIGYPRTVQRPDGKIVTLYYFHEQPRGELLPLTAAMTMAKTSITVAV